MGAVGTKSVPLGPPEDLRGPQKGHFGSKRPKCDNYNFWVPTASHWPLWVGLMVTTHFDLVSGPFWAPWDPKRAHFGPKIPFLWHPISLHDNTWCCTVSALANYCVVHLVIFYYFLKVSTMTMTGSISTTGLLR